jgi:hypothetical protein
MSCCCIFYSNETLKSKWEEMVMKKVLLLVLAALLLITGLAWADETFQIDGDYRFRFDQLKGTIHEYYDFQQVLGWMLGGMVGPPPATVPSHDVQNNALMTNRFGLNIKATPVEDINVKARLIMYKVFGHQTSTPVNGSYFADRAIGVNDGTVGHIPQDSVIRADYAYATWSNVGQMPVWFSVGRRPSTGGIPTNLKDNREKIGTGGIPAIMVDYAFDGMTVGVAPEIEALPGAYAKLCYGKGFDSGYNDNVTGATLKDTDFVGLNAALYDTESLHVEIQYQKGWHIFDAPSDGGVRHNLGDIDWVGGVVMGKVMNNLNLFFSAAQSKTKPSDELYEVNTSATPWDPSTTAFMPVAGLLYDAPGMGGEKKDKTGTAFYLGGRYDIATTGTKIGLEYNQGSKNWIGMVPAGDDIWTSKLGTRGSVYEAYIIQELPNKAITKKGLAFFKLGYQYYKFDYTGSNSWIGAPKKISDLASSPMNAQMFAPIEKATDIYLTFDVRF